MKNKVTLEDLAGIAGVSIATISRALNNSPAVNDKTKRRVWELAREHGYGFRSHMPSSIDQAVATLSIIVPTPQGRQSWLRDPFFQELLGSIGQAAHDSQCDFLVSHFTPQNFDDLSNVIDKSRVDGVIFLGQSFMHDRLNRLMDKTNRFIVWGGELPGQKYCSVGSDNFKGGSRATAHLLRLGRKRIAFVGNTDGPEIKQRLDGYRSALSEAGIAHDPALFMSAPFDVESAASSVDILLSQNLDIDGIVASNDAIALGALKALERRGISVPHDISLVGYDDVHFAQYSRPALTTIRQDLALAGRLMVAKMLNASETSKMLSERLPTDIIVRGSCGA